MSCADERIRRHPSNTSKWAISRRVTVDGSARGPCLGGKIETPSLHAVFVSVEHVSPLIDAAVVNKHVGPPSLLDLESWRKCLEATRAGSAFARDEEPITEAQLNACSTLLVPLE